MKLIIDVAKDVVLPGEENAVFTLNDVTVVLENIPDHRQTTIDRLREERDKALSDFHVVVDDYESLSRRFEVSQAANDRLLAERDQALADKDRMHEERDEARFTALAESAEASNTAGVVRAFLEAQARDTKAYCDELLRRFNAFCGG